MELLYVKEHLTCKNYISDLHIGFSYQEKQRGDIIKLEEEYFHYFIFLLDGELCMSGKGYLDKELKKNQMFFIPQNSTMEAHVLEDAKFLLFSFDNQFNLCDKLTLEELRAFPESEDPFFVLDIRSPLQMVIDSILFYHGNKVRCRQLHAIKQKEMFMILRAFYTKQEIAAFLSPILNRHLDFKSFILRHYREVKTVEELASLCQISVRSFNRKFNEHFGDSPYSWMLKQRSRHVKQRLADGKTSFSEIIKEFGFSSPAHFTTYCKKYFGHSPSNLRRMLRTEYYEELDDNCY